MKSAQVFVVGSLHFDVVVTAPRLPARDETVVGRKVDFVCGGKGGNQAVAAALNGARTAMAGRVGDDLFAARLLDHLDHAGVERAQLQAGADSTSGMSVAIVDREGDYGAVIVSGANLDLEPGLIQVPPGTRIVLLQNEIPEAVNLDVARKAQAAGAKVLLNAAPMRSMAPALLEASDLIVVNRVEASHLIGRAVARARDALGAAAALAADGLAAIVTLGADGLAVCDARGEPRLQPGFPVNVVSTHGAGDTFVGALAARLVEEDPVNAALRYAQAAAALHVATPIGDRPVADPPRVRDMMS